MTIKLLTPRDLTIGGRTVTYPAGALVTLDSATETGLINSKEATATLTGGITYTPPTPSGQPVPVMAIQSPSSGGVKVLAGSADIGLGVQPPTPLGKYDTITLPPAGGLGVYAVKTGTGFVSEIRCLAGAAVPLILQDSPSRRVGRTIYSGTLSAGQTVKFEDWEKFGVSGIFADYISSAATAQFEFLVG